MSYGAGSVTGDVRIFLQEFRANVNKGTGRALHNSYKAFKEITEEFYKLSSWPSDDDVIRCLKIKKSQLDDRTRIFLYLYRELYYRHAFNRCDIEIDLLHDSFRNYINLFNKLLQHYDSGTKFPEVPLDWLWHCIESFVAQFQYYHHWLCDPKDDYANMKSVVEKYKGTREQKKIQEKWSVSFVLRYLHYFVHAARIPIQYNGPADSGPDAPQLNMMMQMLGFFSLVGLCRVHTMLGDYRTAIDIMKQIDLKNKSAVTKLPSCGISAHYYLAFSLCMTRRFPDAHLLLTTMLKNPRYEKDSKMSRKRFEFTDGAEKEEGKTNAEEELSEKDRYHKGYLSNEAMVNRAWAMLAIAQTQSPSKLDEVVLGNSLEEYFGTEIKEINDDASTADSRTDCYALLFKHAAPEFINTFDPFEQEELAKLTKDTLHEKQFAAFIRMTSKGQDMLKLQSEIQMFKVIPIEQLAQAMGYDEDETGKLHRELIRLKCRMKQNRKVDSWGNSMDTFTMYVADDAVHIQEFQATQLWKYSDVFLRNIQTVSDLCQKLEDEL